MLLSSIIYNDHITYIIEEVPVSLNYLKKLKKVFPNIKIEIKKDNQGYLLTTNGEEIIGFSSIVTDMFKECK